MTVRTLSRSRFSAKSKFGRVESAQTFGRGRYPSESAALVSSILFGAGQKGGFYDLGDPSTLFEDTAGSTPISLVEKPIGRINDKSGNGYNLLQGTATNRPAWSARVNLLSATLPTGLRNGTGALIPNAFGEVSGYQLVKTAGSDEVFISVPPTALFPGASYTLDIYLAVGASVFPEAAFSLYTSAGAATAHINYSTGGFRSGESANGFSCSLVSSESVAGGWRTRIEFHIPASASVITLARVYMWSRAATGSPGVIVGNPQFTLAAAAHLPYQSVNTDTDYDADPNKFPRFLRFDGVDDTLSATVPSLGSNCSIAKITMDGYVEFLDGQTISGTYTINSGRVVANIFRETPFTPGERDLITAWGNAKLKK